MARVDVNRDKTGKGFLVYMMDINEYGEIVINYSSDKGNYSFSAAEFLSALVKESLNPAFESEKKFPTENVYVFKLVKSDSGKVLIDYQNGKHKRIFTPRELLDSSFDVFWMLRDNFEHGLNR